MKIFLIIVISFFGICSNAQNSEYSIKRNIHYYPQNDYKPDKYIEKRCVLDIYYPKNFNNFATIIWFHGGGLRTGNKIIPDALKEQGIAVVAVNYRLYPRVKAPLYIEDAAAAVSWTIKNIISYGGDSTLVFISGHSAGGYLASMVGLDRRWLAKFGIDANLIAGLIPLSGHTITHFTVREERGISGTTPIVDELAPLYHVRADAMPILLITGDRSLEMFGRYEENAYLARMMQVAGHNETRLIELQGYDHGGMVEPALPLVLKEVKRIIKR